LIQFKGLLANLEGSVAFLETDIDYQTGLFRNKLRNVF